MSTHNLCFEQKYEKYQSFLSENYQFLKFSVYLNRRVSVMMTFWLKKSASSGAMCHYLFVFHFVFLCEPVNVSVRTASRLCAA